MLSFYIRILQEMRGYGWQVFPYFCLPFSPFPFPSSTSSKWTGKEGPDHHQGVLEVKF